MPENYSFTTHWYVRAPVEVVWETIRQSEAWPEWWKGMLSVKELEKGDERGIGSIREYRIKSPMNYTLFFRLSLTDRVEYQFLSGNATGELEGVGAWHFQTEGDITHVTCEWNVHTNLGWMNTFAFMLKPVFKFNHSLVMKWGAQSLAKRLNTEVRYN
ncbi:MAG: SRPBCC family protein [Bacteroidetes bacterium]|nr:SRPBCC family protein [Bacteroidota bacterium]